MGIVFLRSSQPVLNASINNKGGNADLSTSRVIKLVAMPWLRPLTEVQKIFSLSNFSIDGFNATLCIAICPPVVE